MIPEFKLPPLSETWAAAYLQILITAFVFALGIIPALASQLVVPDSLRQVAHRLRFRRWLISVVFVFVVSILAVWVMQSLAVDPRLMKYAPSMSLASVVIVTLTPILAALSGMMVFLEFKRDKVIPRLERKLKRSYGGGSFEGGAFDDLLHLGEQGKAGAEKATVLRVLSGLAAHAQARKVYNGDELDELIRSVGAVVSNRERPGDGANFRQAADILRDVLRRHSARAPGVEINATLAVHTFARLADEVARKEDEGLVFYYLEQSQGFGADIIFGMGLSALRARRFVTANGALNRLEVSAQKSAKAVLETRSSLAAERAARRNKGGPEKKAPPAEACSEGALKEREAAHQENMALLLGLLAHFADSGPSAYQRARVSLERNKNLLTPSLQSCLDRAFDYHYLRGAYETSDKLKEFPDSFLRQPPRLDGPDGEPTARPET